MNGKSSGFVGGAASGAAIGAEVGGPYGAIIGGVIGGVAGLFSGGAADAQQKNRQAWARYNALMDYNNNQQNLTSQFALGAMNTMMSMAAASARAQANNALIEWNVKQIFQTMEYNDALFEEDLARNWEEAGLDLMQLSQQRALERGAIVAGQSASGTVIGQGSNADVLVSQKTMEAMDAFIVQRGADMQAADIRNARARSWWEGEMQAQKIMFEGSLQNTVDLTNTAMQAAGSMFSNTLAFQSGMQTSGNKYASDMSSVRLDQQNYSFAQNQQLISSLFSAAQKGAQTYYQGKSVGGTQYTSLLADSGGRADFDTGYGNQYFDVWGE